MDYLHQSPGDARQIQQVIDQAGHVVDLPHDDGARLAHAGFTQACRREHLRCSADGRQWVAQLVRQHGQKLVLALAFAFEEFLAHLLVMDVGARAHPADDLMGLVPNRQGAS